MTGLEKIINKIECDSAQKCSDIITAAQKQAEEIAVRAIADGETLIAYANETARHQAKETIRMANSSAAQKAKQIILAARVEALNETFSAAAHALNQLPVKDYFNSLLLLAVKNAVPGKGEMRLSTTDLERLPQGFQTDLNNALKDISKKITISNQPVEIGQGFVLVYGDVEINCAFNVLLDANREELKEIICSIIFS